MSVVPSRYCAPESRSRNPSGFRADEQTGARTAPNAAPQILSDGIGSEPKLTVRLHIDNLDAVFIVIDNDWVTLAGQIRLNERKKQQNDDDAQQKHRHFIAREHTQCAPPVGIA